MITKALSEAIRNKVVPSIDVLLMSIKAGHMAVTMDHVSPIHSSLRRGKRLSATCKPRIPGSPAYRRVRRPAVIKPIKSRIVETAVSAMATV